MFEHMLRSSMGSCELVLEEVHCYMFWVLKQCGLILVNFMYSRISVFYCFKDDSLSDQYLD